MSIMATHAFASKWADLLAGRVRPISYAVQRRGGIGGRRACQADQPLTATVEMVPSIRDCIRKASVGLQMPRTLEVGSGPCASASDARLG